MANFLLHQKRDGTPMGVFTERGHYYHPDSKEHQSYGLAVVGSRGSEVSWEDWIDQLANKTPGPNDMWEVFPSGPAALVDVLEDARNDLSYD